MEEDKKITVKELVEYVDRRISVLEGCRDQAPTTGIIERLEELRKFKIYIELREKESEESEIEKELKRFLSSEEYDKARGDGNVLVAKHFAEWGRKNCGKSASELNRLCLTCTNQKGCMACENGSLWTGDAPLPQGDNKKDRVLREIDYAYGKMDKCVTHILNARVEHNEDAENRALMEMEGLMVSSMQLLTYMKEYLTEDKK